MNQNGSQIFVQGHPEYDRMTLNNEYHRDLNKGLNPALPVHYYEHDDPFSRSAASVEKYGEHAVYELAELLRISGYSVYVGGRRGVVSWNPLFYACSHRLRLSAENVCTCHILA